MSESKNSNEGSSSKSTRGRGSRGGRGRSRGGQKWVKKDQPENEQQDEKKQHIRHEKPHPRSDEKPKRGRGGYSKSRGKEQTKNEKNPRKIYNSNEKDDEKQQNTRKSYNDHKFKKKGKSEYVKKEQQQKKTTNSNNDKNNERNKGNKKRSARKQIYEEYLTLEEVEEGVNNGTIVIGELFIAKYPAQAYVKQENGKDISVRGRVDMNRAFGGEIVACQLFPPSSDKKTKNNESDEETEDSEDSEEILLCKKAEELEESEESEESEKETKEERKKGKIVRIMEEKRSESFFGVIESKLFKPLNSFTPYMIIHQDKTTDLKELENSFVTVQYKGWPNSSFYPFGKLISVEGEVDKFDTQYTALKVKNKITQSEEFADELLKDLPLSGWSIPDEEILNRKDLRNEIIFSIDPPTAKDLDDALSCEKLPNGNFKVGVHIADVSYFVKQNSKLDLEARSRGNTVYFVTENVPMLPRILCDELCSLQDHVDRLAFSVIWELTPDGKRVHEEFTKSIICSKAKFDYATAQEMILHPELFLSKEDELSKLCCTSVNHLNSIAKNLTKARYENGSLSLDNAEIHFDFDENGYITNVKPYERYDSHFLVEEFMLLANIAVAEKINSCMNEGALLRWHPKPDATKLEIFSKQCSDLGISVDCTSSKTLHDSIQNISKRFNGLTMDAILYLASQPMQSALYCSTSLECKGDENAYRHYALNFPFYTHFTSPIRRYPDLIVHRQLFAILNNEKKSASLSPDVISSICNNCNQRKREADYASRDCRRLYLNQYLRTKRFIEKGIVVDLGKSSLTVLVPDYDIRCQFALKDVKSYSFKYFSASNEIMVYWKPENGQIAADSSNKKTQDDPSDLNLSKLSLDDKEQNDNDNSNPESKNQSKANEDENSSSQEKNEKTSKKRRRTRGKRANKSGEPKDDDPIYKSDVTTRLKLLEIIDVELLHTNENFCRTIGLKLARPGEREKLLVDSAFSNKEEDEVESQ